MQDFEGKTAVVTGAASGIGRALAERFAAARMNVVLADIEEGALDCAVKEMAERQYRVIGLPVNTMRRDSVQALAARAVREFGKIHILCNNAGVANRNDASKAVWELPEADWNWVMGVNFWGVLYGLQAFVPGMLTHGEEGHIVNTASMGGLLSGGGIYGASKHAVVSLSESLHHDLKARGAPVSASVLCPGLVSTEIINAERNRPQELETGAVLDPEKTAMATTAFAMGMPPSEVADIVFDSIRSDRFYILTHPAWDGMVRARAEAAIARGAPAILDVAGLTRRRDAGEQF
jgi:NAD(P)-dependent dehydrogenase (short-subunit alcohol dehydrogenase family)